MEQKTLNFTIRKETKKGPARRLRRMGKIPSVIYGHNDPVAIAIDAHEFNTKFKSVSESTIITLQSSDLSCDVLVKDFQEDLIKGRITHIDFYEIEKGKLLRTRVPVHLEGTPEGVREGGLLEVLTHEVDVECMPKDLPHEITIDISDLMIGQSAHADVLPAMDGVKYLIAQDQVICTILKHKEKLLVEEEELAEEEALEGEVEAEAAAAEAEEEKPEE